LQSGDIHQVVRVLRKEVRKWPLPAIGHYVETPCTVLISCILSLRTQDRTTNAASERLFAIAETPQTMLATQKTPEDTEMALRRKLPRRYWLIYNDLLVAYGQNLCKPISPFCSKCKIAVFCKRVGVTTRR